MTTSHTPSQPLGRSWIPRINWRLICFIALVSAPFVWISYISIQHVVTGGIVRQGDVTLVDLKELGNFPMDEDRGGLAEIPQRFRALDGTKVALDGMLWAGGSVANQLRHCELVYNIQSCCFNGPPKVQERVFLFGNNQRTFPYYSDLVRVVGTLHVRLRKFPEGKIASVYDLTVESVTPQG